MWGGEGVVRWGVGGYERAHHLLGIPVVLHALQIAGTRSRDEKVRHRCPYIQIPQTIITWTSQSFELSAQGEFRSST